MNERRSQVRLLDSELVIICWIERGVELKQLANVDDFSLGGIGLVVDEDIPVNTSVTISYGYGDLTGVVRHRSQRRDGHFVGVEFRGDSKDSTLHFHPELLLYPV